MQEWGQISLQEYPFGCHEGRFMWKKWEVGAGVGGRGTWVREPRRGLLGGNGVGSWG